MLPTEYVATIKTNVTFYVLSLLLVLILNNLVKNTFNLGYFKYTNETKLEIFMALKAFAIVYCSFKFADTSSLFDYDLAKCHEDLNKRIN